MTEFTDRIKEGLAKLKKRHPASYDLNPVADEDDILDFEEEYNCSLPTKYREFLLHVGNGGAGPSFGIQPLGMMDDRPWTNESLVRPDLPFPFTSAHNDTSILTRGAPERSEFKNIEDYEKADEEWYDKHRNDLFTAYCIAHNLNGAIPIVEHGCALRAWLVVADGPEYGYIWEERLADEEGVFPLKSKKHERYTFDMWYLEWLKDKLRKLK